MRRRARSSTARRRVRCTAGPRRGGRALRSGPEPGGPVAPQLSMFLIADNQVHELAGARFPGQTELADLLVPTAVRPVEQDMLSMASVAQLRRMFEAVVRDTHGPMAWAHLGDLGDLACTDELARARDALST